MELTNALRKTFASLDTPKGRRLSGLFMAQGTKCVLDTIDHFQLECLLATAEWIGEHASYASVATAAKKADLERISSLSTPPQAIAVYRQPEWTMPKSLDSDTLYPALDCVQDPGNLGTIMRVADWMGVTDIFASPDTADVWSPKVVQATMGAISRVRVHYTHLPTLLEANPACRIYGTHLDGENIYKSSLSKGGIIVMGNEGKGISATVAELVNKRLYIPPYPCGADTSESLNVAIATAITLSEFRRRI